MGKYFNKINLVVFNILIWHFYQIHKLIDGIAINVYVTLKKFSRTSYKKCWGVMLEGFLAIPEIMGP
jgi:hypothetical protein